MRSPPGRRLLQPLPPPILCNTPPHGRLAPPPPDGRSGHGNLNRPWIKRVNMYSRGVYSLTPPLFNANSRELITDAQEPTLAISSSNLALKRGRLTLSPIRRLALSLRPRVVETKLSGGIGRAQRGAGEKAYVSSCPRPLAFLPAPSRPGSHVGVEPQWRRLELLEQRLVWSRRRGLAGRPLER